MVIKRSYLAFCAFFCLTVAMPLNVNDRIINFSNIIGNPPFLYQKSSEKSVFNEIIPPGSDSKVLQGYYWNLVRESYLRKGYTIDLTVAIWTRSLSFMENHTVDLILAATRTKSRSQKYYSSREEVHKIDIGIYGAKDLSIEWNSLESSGGRTAAVRREFTHGGKFETAAHAKRYGIGFQKQGIALIDTNGLLRFADLSQINDYHLEVQNLGDKYKKLPPFESNAEFIAGMEDNPKVIMLFADYDQVKRAIARYRTWNRI